MEQTKCPKCGWGSRTSFLVRSKVYKCGHCGHKWVKQEVSKAK